MNYKNMDKEELIKILIQKDEILKRLYLEKEKLNYYAGTDAMTGTLNRRSGLSLLNKELNLSKNNSKNLVVCFIDVDKLKRINDAFGHEEGDKVLIKVAKTLKESVRKTDFVIRMGGDEFLIVFPETTMKEANKVWYRISRRVEDLNKYSHNYNLSLSYGFYEYSKETQKKICINDLIKKADAEMYKEKLKKRRNFYSICIINSKYVKILKKGVVLNMERFKADVLLFIYNDLQEGKVVRKNDIIDKFNINERTFYRYMKDIKDFVEKPDGTLIGEKVIVDREKGGYILKGKNEKNINAKEVLAVSKVLLESRGFIKPEIECMINKLLDNCICEDKENVKQIIGNELVNYVSPQHGKKLLDKLWEISSAIKDQKILDIEYYKIGKDGKLKEEVCKRIVYPQGLLFSEYYFYLIAFIEGKSYEYPTIYRVDRIKDLVITDRKYKVNYSSRFQDGEFRKLIQFMHAGELERIKFKFTGGSIEAVLDRLPNAKVVKEKQGEYTMQANVFGKGIKMWLLSQGDSVEVLGPDKFRKEMKNTIEEMRNVYI
ncbi:TPA: diguanylate cyclase [Clostridium botulinum]|nr:diguanylate cyclase [Clostridium botulinum]HDK7158742.1 diguanylate cyclase [Clostridium botulinum]